MFQNLLVPLDGSQLAEAVLIPLSVLAQQLGTTITLLHVIEENPPSRVHGERHLTTPAEAKGYLEEIATRLSGAGVTVDIHVHSAAEGDVAKSIVDHAADLAVDMVVLATHGRGGLRGLLLGSIAQQVVSRGTTPVLIVHPDAMPENWQPERIAVALDGEPCHETSLPTAAFLARRLDARLYLFSVVPHPGDLSGTKAVSGRLLPTATAARLDLEEKKANEYLADLAKKHTEDSLVIKGEVRRGEPGTELVAALRRREVDLLVLATHALKGWDAFWAGSVTPKVLKSWRRPVLLVQAE